MDHTWSKQWKEDEGADVGPVEKDDFVAAFLDWFFPFELRETDTTQTRA